jgi:hypothetical protein
MSAENNGQNLPNTDTNVLGHRVTTVNNQTASLHEEMDGPRSGNPRLAYGFRATFKQALGLDDHHKRHPFAVIFRPPPQPFLSTHTSPSARPLPAPTALIGSQQVSSETFPNLRSSLTLHCVASFLSFHPYAHYAVQL